MAKDINWRALFPPPDTRFDRYKETNPRPPGGVPWFFDKMPTPKPRPKPAYPKDVHPGTGLPSWIWKHLEDRPKETHPRPMPERGGDPWLPLPGMPGGIQNLPYIPNPEFSDMPSTRTLPYRPNPAFSDTATNPLSFASTSMVPRPRIPTAQEQVKGAVSLPDEKAKSFSRIHDAHSRGADLISGDWSTKLQVPAEYVEMYLAVPEAAKKYAYDNPTDLVLEQFEEKYGFPLDMRVDIHALEFGEDAKP